MNNNIRFIDATSAMKIAGVSRTAIIKWCRDLRIGFKVAGRWKIDKDKLQETLEGKRFYGKK